MAKLWNISPHNVWDIAQTEGIAWTICLLGTDTYVAPDSNSLVTLSSLETTDPLLDPNWHKFVVSGGRRKRVQLNEIKERVGGYMPHQPGGRMILTPPVKPYRFPSDMLDLDNALNTLDKKYLYLHQGTYTFNLIDPNIGATTWMLHDALKAIMVSADYAVEQDEENGYHKLELTFYKFMPVK